MLSAPPSPRRPLQHRGDLVIALRDAEHKDDSDDTKSGAAVSV